MIQEDESNKSKRTITIGTLISLLFGVGLVLLIGFDYLHLKQEVNSLKQEVNSLKQEVSTLGRKFR